MRRQPEPIHLASLTEADYRRVAGELAAARLAVFPTDTVYGVGGLLSPGVMRAIVSAKGRASGKPLQVIYPSLDLLETTIALDARLRDAVRCLLPGPFTLLLPYPQGLGFPPPGEVAHQVQGTFGPRAETRATLGVRVPRWPDAARLMAALPFALIASSANPSGDPAPRALNEVGAGLLGACDVALDGGTLAGMASTIVDLSTYAGDGRWRVVRRGSVDEDGVAALLAAAAGGG